MSEPDEYTQQMLAYEQSAYDAAESGDNQTAVTVWTQIVDNDDYRTFFGQVPEALKEIHWNLATSLWRLGQEDQARAVLAKGGIDVAEFEQSVQAPA